MTRKLFCLSVVLFLFSGLLSAQGEARLLRFPAIKGNQIAFTYAGDLYSVPRTGGLARKLTNDIGFEMFARFSPDGSKIAFTSQYDGNSEVYIIPAEGGKPQRLTYTATLHRDDVADRMGPNNIVMCWRDNNSVVYRSRKKTFNDFKGQLFVANINGGISEELPLPCGGFCSYSPDGKKLAYNRIFREFRTWKYYKGGMADDISIYDFDSKKTENITNNVAQDIFPMWKGDFIYFLSDRDRTMNLFSYNTKTKETKKLTNFTEYDIKFPSLGDNEIVFENGGYIYVYDINSAKADKVSIIISDDNLYGGKEELKDASKNIESSAISPDGKRVAFIARGDLYTVPAKTGITKNLTKTSGVHERNADWSPDGRYLAYISDETGEDEIYIRENDWNSKSIQLTNGDKNYKYSIRWSPDSKKIMWSDKMMRLQFVDIDSKKVTLVDKTIDGEYSDYQWSPDSKWIAFPRPDRSAQTKIYLYELATGTKTAVTDGWYGSGSPSFSRDGKYLFFTSNRDFNPIYSWTEWNHAYVDMTKIYLVTLSKDTQSPFQPIDDEVAVKKEEKKDNSAKDKVRKEKEVKKESDEVTVKVDLDGITGRIIGLPVEASSYWSLQPLGDGIYYMKGGFKDSKASIKYYDLKDKKETVIGQINGFDISSDGKKMLVANDGKYFVTDVPKTSLELKDAIDLSGMKTNVDLRLEWAQIYNESWRQMRDFFYDPNMHGVNWESMKKKYEPLIPYVNNRSDLTYIIGELIGELNVGHAYVGDGDRTLPEKINMGLLGAELSKEKSGYYKISKILKGENWTGNCRSPLTEVGVNVKEGDYIIAVNGMPTNKMVDINKAFVNTAGKQVELTVNSSESENGSRKVIVIPINDESELYYYNWVQNNIKKVDEASNGQIGYIHIPNMLTEGLNEFVKHFYPQLNKKALIIDDRGNGGGNVSPMIIERLNRELTLMGMGRNTAPHQSPDMNIGPKVCLIDHYSASDGDLFPYRFKYLKIGKVIGVRSWGGVVGIRGSLPFIDGGSLTKPEFAHYAADGKDWIIEGHGVDPDIVVDNDPAKEYAGEDEQLNKGIQVLMEELKNKKVELPGIPPFPNKSK
ncbi:MAG: PDZ domain-containing protein [Bacteroidota bacterium]|nr:PDZ domain-containing protein [Bacteroidota bacterium]